jgi:hypothetical protein
MASHTRVSRGAVERNVSRNSSFVLSTTWIRSARKRRRPHSADRSHLSAWPVLGMLLTACAGQESSQRGTAVVDPPDAGQQESDAASTADMTPASSAACKITPSWLEPHKQCDADSDCQVIGYRTGCCPAEQVVGIAKLDADEVQACADEAPPVCPTTASCKGGLSRAEDGRATRDNLDNVAVSCVDHVCTTKVTKRPCGNALSCDSDEVCVVYQNTPNSVPSSPDTGNNALFSYACIKNDCQQHLDCKCAQALCDLRQDAQRVCAIEFADAHEGDVECTPMHD